MHKILFIFAMAVNLLACQSTDNNRQQSGLAKMADSEEIIHTVIFNLPYEPGSVEAKDFLQEGFQKLTSIPVVNEFEVRRQVSAKNEYQYGFSMKFKNQADYQTYNDHPVHVDFVENRWKKEVTDFLEIDYKVLDPQNLP
jgi:hypothetical protein